ncbi:MAG: branched chain amino acid aminotransferase, partial [Planctomycetota bacterium]
GYEVRETILTLDNVREADEAFSTGNANKIVPIVKFDDREYGVGPVAAEVRQRFWDYAHA